MITEKHVEFLGAVEAGLGDFYETGVPVSHEQHIELCARVLRAIQDYRDELGIPDTSWKRLFPEGRTIFYEGDDPEGFRQQIKAEFGFDPAGLPARNIFTGEPEAAMALP
jgi:hypothetical protein